MYMKTIRDIANYNAFRPYFYYTAEKEGRSFFRVRNMLLGIEYPDEFNTIEDAVSFIAVQRNKENQNAH